MSPSLKCAAALFLALAALAGSAFASTQTCSTASLGEPFVLPDGTRHEAGTLTICLDRENSPVSYLHHAYVDRMPVGMMTGNRELVVGDTESGHYMLFERDAGNVLRLSGYAIPGQDRVAVYSIDRPARVEVKDSIAH